MGHVERKTAFPEGSDQSALVERLLDLARMLRDRWSDRCESEGLSAPRCALLHAVAQGEDDGCSQTELAAELGLSESNVCSLVERMRSTGLLFRFRSRIDRRKSVLMLTERGRELARTIQKARTTEAEWVLGCLDSEKRSMLENLLTQLQAHLHRTPQVLVSPQDSSNPECWDRAVCNTDDADPETERPSRRAS